MKRSLRVVLVSPFFSDGMGYTENCFPRALAALGHEVHVVTSIYNVYGNEPSYASSYGTFLGPTSVAPGSYELDGYTVHRLPAKLLFGYVRQRGLGRAVARLRPDIVHVMEIASLQAFELAPRRWLDGYRLFSESHQHLSVMRREVLAPSGHRWTKLHYWLTRTLPSTIAIKAFERCYAIAPDCAEVASRFYGVPKHMIEVRELGTDTDLFQPAVDSEGLHARAMLRRQLGYDDSHIVCVYTGRFTKDKNPLLVAQAIGNMVARNDRFRGLFVGEGVQREEIARIPGCQVLPFMRHRSLAEHYRASDIGVWPTQESMSMLDAASAGLPLVVSDKIGEPERVIGNGIMFASGDVESLCNALEGLTEISRREALGIEGRRKMVERFSWRRYALAMERDYLLAIGDVEAR